MGNKNKSRKVANDGFTASANTKKQSGGSKIPVICMILVLALCVGVIAYSKVVDSGLFYRTTVSVSSENFEVNNAMLSYFFNVQYQQLASTLSQMGVDTSSNLKNLQYSGEKSWYDYIMEQTIAQVENILVLCEAAKAEGFEMSEHDREHIDEAMDSLNEMAKTSAKQYGVSESYAIRNVYGYGVNADDIRDALELSQLASAYSTKLTDSYEYTEEEWDKYLEENRDDFLVIDYVSYTFDKTNFVTEDAEEDATDSADSSVSDTSAADSATVTEVAATASGAEGTTASSAEEEVKELAAEAQAAKDKANALYQELITFPDSALEIFNVNVKEHLENVVYASTEDADKKEESVASAMDGTVTEAAANDDSDEFLKFAFGTERDKNAFISEDDTNGKYTVYLLTKDPYVEDYVTKDVRVIVLNSSSGDLDEAREAVLDEFEEGDKSEDSFAELAKTHSADSSAHENGGLYENQGKTDLGVDELNEWLYSADRKNGDYTYASNGQTGDSAGVYIVYYIGDGLVKWQRDVNSTMISEAYEAEVDKLTETHKVTSDLVEAYKIPSQAGV